MNVTTPKGRFGEPVPVLTGHVHMTPEQMLLKALNAFGQRLDMLVTGVQAVAQRAIPAPVVNVPPNPEPQVHVEVDTGEIADAIRQLPQPDLDAGQIATALAQVLEGHEFKLAPAVLKALKEGRGGGGSISMPNLRDIQLRDASHELVNPATKESVEAVTASLGTDGTSPPTILGSGTGVRGWLRSIYERITGAGAIVTPEASAEWAVKGTVSAGSPIADPPVLIAMSDGTNVRLPIMEADNADAVAVSATKHHPANLSRLQLFNGTSWDRARGDTANGLDVDVTRMAALVAGTAQVGSTIPDRPSQGPGRVMKSLQADAVTADTTAYTVTGGKVLYVTSWGGTLQNTSTVAMGHLRLRDGGAGGTIIASWTVPTAIAGTQAPHQRLFASFLEPKQFSTDVFLDVVSGTLTICFQANGYEE